MHTTVLMKISTPSGKVAISYDALGRQIRLESDGKVREFIYAGQRLIEWRENGVLTAQIVPLERPHQYAHLAIGGTDCWPISDKVDSVLGWIKSSDGEIIGKTSFDPFGEIIEQDGNLVVPFGFAGYFREGKSGVYQLPARSYHSRFGRFLQKDPMGLVDGFNLYAYAHHAPGSLIDYWGFDSSALIEVGLPPVWNG